MTRKTLKLKADPNKAVGYLRVSTDEQADSGLGLAAQEAAVKAYCTMKGLDLVALIVDPGVSAGKPLDTRPGGRDLGDKLRAREAGSVVALKLDRLFRSVVDCLQVIEGWERNGVALHLVDFGGMAVDTSSAIGKMFLTISSGFAEFERNLTKERTKAAMGTKKVKGERVGSIPYGFTLCPDGITLQANEAEAALVNEVKDRYHNQGQSAQTILDWLRGPGVWLRASLPHLTTVYRIVKA